MRSIVNTLATLMFLGTSGMVAAQDKAAPVATLEKPEGTVMVNKGSGYITYKGTTPLNEGDSVVTLNRSSAEILFRDGCRAQLKANNLMAISINPGCKGSIVAVNPYTATGAAAAPSMMQPLAIAALVGGGIALLANSGNDDTPISGQ